MIHVHVDLVKNIKSAMGDKLSIKNFLLFSLFIYPIGLLILIFHNDLIIFFGSNILYYIISYIFFSAINYLWGQYRTRPYLIAISCSFGLILFFIWLSRDFIDFTDLNSDLIITILGSIVIYFTTFLIFQFIQFFTWIPFILNYLWRNRHNLDNLKFD